jgi:hypothetical protein
MGAGVIAERAEHHSSRPAISGQIFSVGPFSELQSGIESCVFGRRQMRQIKGSVRQLAVDALGTPRLAVLYGSPAGGVQGR